jgi:hypothetical protein
LTLLRVGQGKLEKPARRLDPVGGKEWGAKVCTFNAIRVDC